MGFPPALEFVSPRRALLPLIFAQQWDKTKWRASHSPLAAHCPLSGAASFPLSLPRHHRNHPSPHFVKLGRPPNIDALALKAALHGTQGIPRPFLRGDAKEVNLCLLSEKTRFCGASIWSASNTLPNPHMLFSGVDAERFREQIISLTQMTQY